MVIAVRSLATRTDVAAERSCSVGIRNGGTAVDGRHSTGNVGEGITNCGRERRDQSNLSSGCKPILLSVGDSFGNGRVVFTFDVVVGVHRKSPFGNCCGLDVIYETIVRGCIFRTEVTWFRICFTESLKGKMRTCTTDRMGKHSSTVRKETVIRRRFRSNVT